MRFRGKDGSEGPGTSMLFLLHTYITSEFYQRVCHLDPLSSNMDTLWPETFNDLSPVSDLRVFCYVHKSAEMSRELINPTMIVKIGLPLLTHPSPLQSLMMSFITIFQQEMTWERNIFHSSGKIWLHFLLSRINDGTHTTKKKDTIISKIKTCDYYGHKDDFNSKQNSDLHFWLIIW